MTQLSVSRPFSVGSVKRPVKNNHLIGEDSSPSPPTSPVGGDHATRKVSPPGSRRTGWRFPCKMFRRPCACGGDRRGTADKAQKSTVPKGTSPSVSCNERRKARKPTFTPGTEPRNPDDPGWCSPLWNRYQAQHFQTAQSTITSTVKHGTARGKLYTIAHPPCPRFDGERKHS